MPSACLISSKIASVLPSASASRTRCSLCLLRAISHFDVRQAVRVSGAPFSLDFPGRADAFRTANSGSIQVFTQTDPEAGDLRRRLIFPPAHLLPGSGTPTLFVNAWV